MITVNRLLTKRKQKTLKRCTIRHLFKIKIQYAVEKFNNSKMKLIFAPTKCVLKKG